MSTYKMTRDDYEIIDSSPSNGCIFIVDPEVTELMGEINNVKMFIDLFQMTDRVKYINPDLFFITASVDKFRIIDHETGETIVETEAFARSVEYGYLYGIDESFEGFVYDYNKNPAEAIEKLKRGDYDIIENQ